MVRMAGVIGGLRVEEIDRCKGNTGDVTNVQQLAIDKLLAAAKDLELQGVVFTYSKKHGFKFKQARK